MYKWGIPEDLKKDFVSNKIMSGWHIPHKLDSLITEPVEFFTVREKFVDNIPGPGLLRRCLKESNLMCNKFTFSYWKISILFTER